MHALHTTSTRLAKYSLPETQERAMSKTSQEDQNGYHPPKGDGIPDGVEKPIEPAGANRPDPKPKNKDGDVEEEAHGRLSRNQR
jgi:hypothetical protein